MKHKELLKSGIIIVAALVVVMVMNWVSAAGTYSPINPPVGTPSEFLTIGSGSQAKSGNLALGTFSASGTPSTTLDVKGTFVTDVIGSLGTSWISGFFKVGGATAVPANNSQLNVQTSRIRSTILAGTGERTICADSLGRLKICGGQVNTASNGECGNASGSVFLSTPTTNLCTNGTASTVTGTGPWSWTCAGTNGGADATCMANKIAAPTSVDGVCGTNNDCASGVYLDTYTTGPWNDTPTCNSWNKTYVCLGINGGANSNTCLGEVACFGGATYVNGCFLAGTDITRADGTLQNIEKLSLGDKVAASHEQTNTVEKLMEFAYQGWVYGINGSKPFVTETHPFMTTEGWKSFNPEKTKSTNPDLTVTLLQVGDTLLKENGVTEKITKISREWMNTTVYNFTASGTHEYYADGYQVHNKNSYYCDMPGCNTSSGGTPTNPPSPGLCGQYTNNGPTCAAGATSSNSGVANSICPDGPQSTTGSLVHTWTCSAGNVSQTCGGCEAPGYSTGGSSGGNGGGSNWYEMTTSVGGNLNETCSAWVARAEGTLHTQAIQRIGVDYISNTFNLNHKNTGAWNKCAYSFTSQQTIPLAGGISGKSSCFYKDMGDAFPNARPVKSCSDTNALIPTYNVAQTPSTISAQTWVNY